MLIHKTSPQTFAVTLSNLNWWIYYSFTDRLIGKYAIERCVRHSAIPNVCCYTTLWITNDQKTNKIARSKKTMHFCHIYHGQMPTNLNKNCVHCLKWRHRRHLESTTSTTVYLNQHSAGENRAKFHPDWIWNDVPRRTKSRTRTRWVASSHDIPSVKGHAHCWVTEELEWCGTCWSTNLATAGIVRLMGAAALVQWRHTTSVDPSSS